MQDRFFGRLLLFLLAGFTVCYTVYMTARFFTPDYRTETAYSYTIADSCRIRAVAVREEEVLTSSQTGAYSYLCEDGDVVLATTAVASVYQSTEDLLLEAQCRRLEEEIEALQGAERVQALTVSDTVSAELNEATGSLAQSVAGGDLSELSAQRSRIQLLLAKRLIATGKQSDFTERIAALRTRISETQSKRNAASQQVTAGAAGYFCSVTDGYEGVLPFSTDALTASAVRGVADGTTAPTVYSNAIGKVQKGFRWYLAAALDSKTASEFTEGASVTLDFGVSGATEIPAQVCLVREEENATLVVLRCEYVSGTLLRLRTASVEVRFRSYTGLRVNREAIRYQELTEGVYVKSGNLVEFKPIERIYEGDSYVLCAENSSLANSLEQFDEVIVSGSDLYDGKVLS